MIYFKAAFRKLRCLGVADPSTDHQPLTEAYRCSVVRQTLLCTRWSLSPLQRRGRSLRGWRQWCGPGRFWACTATPSRENTPRRSGLLSATTEIPREPAAAERLCPGRNFREDGRLQLLSLLLPNPRLLLALEGTLVPSVPKEPFPTEAWPAACCGCDGRNYHEVVLSCSAIGCLTENGNKLMANKEFI